MYGYIIPDKLNLPLKDYYLYRSFYCGTCKATSKSGYGQLARLTANYDITFFAVFLHAYLKVNPEFYNAACILNPFKKKTIVKSSDLMKRITALNILMSYHNLGDDVIDGEGLKKYAARFMLKRAYKKARKRLPGCDINIRTHYGALKGLENENCGSVDRTADCFASMLRDCARAVTGVEDDLNLDNLCYFLGKYIYVIDAIDDIDSDIRDNKYNPLAAAYGKEKTRGEFFEKNRAELDYLIFGCVNGMSAAFSAMNITEGYNLLNNIINEGLVRKYKQVLGSEKKLRQERV